MLLQDQLSIKYKYKKLPILVSEFAIDYYKKNIPKQLLINGDNKFKIYSKQNTLISIGYNRIVIGDYGAFIEFDEKQVVKENICIKKGQEYRIYQDKYKKNVKYIWLTAKDGSEIKIYLQQKTVTYADYIPKMFYVSHYDILL